MIEISYNVEIKMKVFCDIDTYSPIKPFQLSSNINFSELINDTMAHLNFLTI